MKKIAVILLMFMLGLNTVAFAEEPIISVVEDSEESIGDIEFPEQIDLTEDEFLEEVITPESEIYTIKRLFEELKGYFYSLDNQKLDYYTELAEKRLMELDLIENEEEKFGYIELLIADFINYMELAQEIADNIDEEELEATDEDEDNDVQDEEEIDVDLDENEEEEEDNEEMLEEALNKNAQKLQKFNEQRERLQHKFEMKIESAPESAKPGLQRALANISKGQEKRIANILRKDPSLKNDEVTDENTEELLQDDVKEEISIESIEGSRESEVNKNNKNNKDNKNNKNVKNNNGNGAKNSNSNSKHNR